MRSGRWALIGLAVAVAAGVVASTRWSLLAQDRAARGQARAKVEASKDAAAPAPAPGSVQDAILRPVDLPFGAETTLEDVRKFLARSLNAPVVLDLAALDRLELTPEDTVRLDLKGVRLKVGLKLLLDQVGLTFRVVAEDNLLILTDPGQSGDPAERALAEAKSLHRDIHDLLDAVDDLRDLVEEDLGVEPETKKDHTALVRAGSRRPDRSRPRPATRRGVRG